MTLLVQKFLKTHSFKELQEQHGVYASFSKSGHKWSLNYDQIEAKESDLLAQECRGLVLACEDGQPIFADITNGKPNRDNIIPGKTTILAYPMKRFFNYGQGSAAPVNWSDPNLAVLEKLDGCFEYNAMLQCWDGTFVKIGDVVKKKLTPTLIGINKDGEIVPCQITNWFNNGTKNHWVEFILSSKSKGKNKKFRSTINHSILVNGEYKAAININVGDYLTSFDNFFDDNGNFVRKQTQTKIIAKKIINFNSKRISGKNYKKIFRHGKVGFDIETTTHNYVINNHFVHNSLAIVYFDKFTDQWCMATRSVPEADLLMDNGLYTFRTLFEKAVKETLNMEFSEFTKHLSLTHTYCFELTTPYNRVVVDYKTCSITLLALRNMNTLSEIDPVTDTISSILPVVQAHTYSTIEELVNWVSSLNPMEHEGVVVRDSNFNRIKVKSAAYVAYHKLNDKLGSSERNCMKYILLEKDDDVISFLPPEIGHNMSKLKEGLNKAIMTYDSVHELIKLNMKALGDATKKDYARMVTNHKTMWHAPFFTFYDNKALNMKDYIHKAKKDGTWTDAFLDKIIDISKQYID